MRRSQWLGFVSGILAGMLSTAGVLLGVSQLLAGWSIVELFVGMTSGSLLTVGVLLIRLLSMRKHRHSSRRTEPSNDNCHLEHSTSNVVQEPSVSYKEVEQALAQLQQEHASLGEYVMQARYWTEYKDIARAITMIQMLVHNMGKSPEELEAFLLLIRSQQEMMKNLSTYCSQLSESLLRRLSP